jgi:PQQ-dependent dehydrogenase (methanol/ethanol family)
MRARSAALALLAMVGLCAGAPPRGWVDAERLRRADAERGSWLTHGRTYDEQRYSPLSSIHRGNVGELGLAWSFSTGTLRGLEATPLIEGGVLYATGSWSVVYALDAATGALRWTYDPAVPRAKGRDACCDVVNRGVALWKGRVYLGALDGRLIALDAASGEPVWQVQTTDPDRPYTITGAPRVLKDLVVIGNGGAEFGVRGYVSAYDAASGALRWRFFTVPSGPLGPHEHPELELAASTWPDDAAYEAGLGGTVWDSMAYDAELDLLYVGVGNASVYERELRSPGGGDNLFLASILALRPDTGRLVWHYQTTPGESWDYTATQHIVLADLEIEGKRRKVLLQAPKNGFFYVLDRATGELISARNYVPVSWATHVDRASGRPVERPEASWSRDRAYVTPGPEGGHNWHPMSYSPRSGLVYVPTIRMAYLFIPDPSFRYQRGRFNTGEDWGGLQASVEGYARALRFCSPTQLLAWDPVGQREVWRVDFDTPVPGGVLSTAGDLVFQGNGGGEFTVYDALSGARLWSAPVGIGIMAAPVTYLAGGEQYVAVLAGVGGSAGIHFTSLDHRNEGRILAFKLGASVPLPPVSPVPAGRVRAPPLDATQETIARGRTLYAEHCLRCHGIDAESSGLLPDLRHASPEVHAQWLEIVLGGTLAARGMASFADVLRTDDAEAIHAYVISRALHTPGTLERIARWAGERACIPASWVAD